jgi:hypothetical protein
MGAKRVGATKLAVVGAALGTLAKLAPVFTMIGVFAFAYVV